MQQAKSQRLDSSREREEILGLYRNKSKSFNQERRQKTLKKKFLSMMTKQTTVNEQGKKVKGTVQISNKFVPKFVNMMLAKKLHFEQLNVYHFEMINDKASQFQESLNQLGLKQKFNSYVHKYRILLQPVWEVLKRMEKETPLLYPESKFKIYWDLTAICARLYFLYLIPVDLAWTKDQLMYIKYFTATLIMLSILFVDIIMSLNTAYYQAGQIVTSRKQILQKLLYKSYGLEWISILILIIVFIIQQSLKSGMNVNDNPFYLIQATFLCHHRNVHQISIQYERALNLGKQASSYLELIKFILFIFYGIHLFACLWFWVIFQEYIQAGEYSQNNYEINWFEGITINNSSWNTQYLTSFYYACVTMFTVGYGDITPKTDLEKIISIIFIMIASIQLPYSINILGNIIQQISAYGEERKNKLRTINTYMHKKNVPYHLQYQIRQYLDHYWQSQSNEESEEEKTIISQLSENLREKLMIQANQPIIDKSPLLRDQFSSQFKQALLTKIKQFVIQPENIVEFNSSSIDETLFMCYIDEGELEVFIDQETNIKLRSLFGGHTLGTFSFITGKKPIEKFKSVGFTKVLILTREDMLHTLKDYPQDQEAFCRIKDDLIFNSNSHLLDVFCFACGSEFHKLIDCPMLHFVPQKELIIKRHIYSQIQERVKHFKRRKRTMIQYISNERIKEFQRINQLKLKMYFMSPNEQIIKPDQEEKGIINVPKLQSQLSLSPFHDRKSSGNDQKLDYLGIQNDYHKNKLITSTQLPQIIVSDKVIDFKDHNEIIAKKSINIVDLIKQRMDIMRIQKHQNLKEKDQIEFLYMKERNNLRIQRKGMEGFEQMKQYQIYYPHENSDIIVGKVYLKARLKIFGEVLSQYLPYIMFPAKFLKQFDILGRKRLSRQGLNADFQLLEEPLDIYDI